MCLSIYAPHRLVLLSRCLLRPFFVEFQFSSLRHLFDSSPWQRRIFKLSETLLRIVP